MSMREWRARRSSIWSRKPMPVEIADAPVPSRSIATSTSVSLVVRLTEPLRMDVTCGQLNGERLVAGVGGVRHFLPLPRVRGRGASEARREGASPRPHAQAASPSPPSPARGGGSAGPVCIEPRGYLNQPDHAGSPMQSPSNSSDAWHGTTILTVRKGGTVAIGGDGQVSIGQTIVKANARKVRRLANGDVIGGFAGATADAFTLFERLEAKLEQYPGQLMRAAVELAKDWRTDRYLRRLEAMMIVADKEVSLVLTGTGDVLEPEAGVMAIGSGGNYALAAARALVDSDKDAETIVRRALDIASDICVFTNRNVTIETLQNG